MAKLNIEAKMKDLLENQKTKAVLEKHMGDLLNDPRMKMGMKMPLRTLFKMAPKGVLPPGSAEAVEAELEALNIIVEDESAPETSGKKGGGLFGIFRRNRKPAKQPKRILINNYGGYMGKILRVDLTKEVLTEENLPDEKTMRQYIGGTGLGVKFMYDEVPANVKWSDPENRLIWLTGPFTGTKAPGSGTYTVATKGPLTGFFGASHCNGFFGARLKFAGYDGIIVQGAANRWLYLYIHNGKAELRGAEHLLGMDTWETEDALLSEVGEKQASVSCIGPAAENLVKYCGICSDKGHIASSNGCGSVMASKKLKAVVVHGTNQVPVYAKDKLTPLVKHWWEMADSTIWGMILPTMGTNGQFASCSNLGSLPVKNYTTNLFPTAQKFNGDSLREYYKGKPKPCYACRFAHCQEIEIKSGPHKGEIVEEPEFEPLTAFSSQIGNPEDVDGAVWLAALNDRLGMDAKEQAFVLGLAIECYEKGLITKEDTGGIEMTWGNLVSVEKMLHKIARREGFGDILAEGVMRAAQKIGGEAPNFAVYTHKGVAPHVHDDRGLWNIGFSMAISDMGSIQAGDMGDVGNMLDTIGNDFLDPAKAFDHEFTAKSQAIMARRGHFIDSLGICMFIAGVEFTHVAETLSAITGWNFTWQECAEAGERIMNMMRSFNVRCGHTRADNCLSPRILEAPIDGPAKGRSIAEKFDEMVSIYYGMMGWDDNGKPLPKTLKRLGLEKVAKELAR